MNNESKLGAVVLAAGLSLRMGKPKLLLPWGETTVIGQVISVISSCAIKPIVVVTGKTHADIHASFANSDIHLAFNPDYEDGRMLTSLKVGLQILTDLRATSTLLALGDQPQIQAKTVQAVVQAYQHNPNQLIIPSYQMHRGHPWVIPFRYWQELCNLPRASTMRDFINLHGQEINYVNIDSATILADLDTPEDYQREKPLQKE